MTDTPSATPTATVVAQQANGSVEYVYDGNGNLVKSIIGDIETYYPNGNYELRVEDSTEVELKYYFAGSVRIAMRVDEVITWLLSDHINSTRITVDGAGDLLTTVKYTAFGEIRSGGSTTDYQYTGQRNEVEIGLYYYVARFYDAQLARFISADTIIPEPGSIKGYDRYAYVNGNPISFNDPSGHRLTDGCLVDGCDYTEYEKAQDAQKLKIVEAQFSQNICQSGYDNYCSNYEMVLNHYPKLVTGVSIGYSAQAGFGIEGGGTYSTSYIMDWKEGNLYTTKDAGAFLYGGTPTGIGGELEFSFFVMHGIPHDETDITRFLTGNQVFLSPELGLDTSIGASASGLLSINIEDTGKLNYILGAGYQTTTGLSLSLTGNEIPNGIEAGLKIGVGSNLSVDKIPLW